MVEYLFTLKRANGEVFTRRKLLTKLEIAYFIKKVDQQKNMPKKYNLK